MMQKYTGHIIEIIYLGQHGNITQRRIEVHSVTEAIIKAHCMQRNAPRVFRIDRILAVKPVVVGKGIA